MTSHDTEPTGHERKPEAEHDGLEPYQEDEVDTQPTGDATAGDASAGDASHDVGENSTVPAADHEALRGERDRLEDQLRRAMTDLASIRKRHAREMQAVQDRAKGDLATELLPVLDNFELALAAHEQTEGSPSAALEGMIEGVQMVRNLLTATLERHGLSEIPSLGETFDPNHHEAVGVDPTGSAAPGTVTHVTQRGYRLGDRILRPTKVLVAGEQSAE